MKIIVTGCAGFVGSRLALALLERGDTILGIDNFDDYYAREHKTRHLSDIANLPAFELAQIDIRDANALNRAFSEFRPEAVLHLAGMASVRYSVQHPLMYAEVNVQGSVNLLEAGRLAGNPRFVLASTGSVYGDTTPLPFSEDAPASEPLAPYPASKRAMEIMAYAYSYQYEIPITVARFFNVYGPHGRPDMMPWKWAQQIARGEPITLFDSGRLKRDWTYVDDIVDGLLAAVDAGFRWEIFNLGCGRPVENRRFVEILEELVGRRAEIIDVSAPSSEPLATFADTSKALLLLGYFPKVQLEEGLANFVSWLRAQRLLEVASA